MCVKVIWPDILFLMLPSEFKTCIMAGKDFWKQKFYWLWKALLGMELQCTHHCFGDYIQILPGLAAKCCDEFAATKKQLMMRNISTSPMQLIWCWWFYLFTRGESHQVNEMFGSLDCVHTGWKICSKGWQASFRMGRASGRPTVVVLEPLCDYNWWCWHEMFGYAGFLNVLNILNLLQCWNLWLMEHLQSWRRAVERLHRINGNVFHQFFVLVDRIYPMNSRFAKGI